MTTIQLRVHDVLRETFRIMDARYDGVRDVVITRPLQPLHVHYNGEKVLAWVIIGESHTADGGPYTVARVATTHQKWSIRRP